MKLSHIKAIEGKIDIQKPNQRVLRNVVNQLATSNPYSLNLPNQRYINESIKKLSETKKEKNINFLLDIASKVKYSTNIVLKNLPKNDWKNILFSAASSGAGLISGRLKRNTDKKIEEIKANFEITNDEKEILSLRKNLVKKVDLKQIQEETKSTIRNFEENLDYFIVSSETSVEHKKYVLKRLNDLMNKTYKIDSQLKDKKSIVVAEIVNDIAINTPNSDIPNIKLVNQKQHGICAEISIVRKKLAYEDKPNYIDMIMSELNDSDEMMVYDRANLGSKKKVPVNKIYIDFNDALEKGYRIIDASSMQWMQIAHMNGQNNTAFQQYTAFDKDNFDVNRDSFFNIKFQDPELKTIQEYYQALVKTKSVLEDYKASKIKNKVIKGERFDNFDKNISTFSQITEALKNELNVINNNFDKDTLQEITTKLLNLEYESYDAIPNDNDYAFIKNEEDVVKKFLIRNLLRDKYKLNNLTEKNVDTIYDLVDYYNSLSIDAQKNGIKNSLTKNFKNLYEIGAAYRYQYILGLQDEKMLNSTLMGTSISNKEELIVDNIDDLICKLENNSPESDLIAQQVLDCFEIELESREQVISILREYRNIVTTKFETYTTAIQNLLGYENTEDYVLTYLGKIKSDVANNNTKVIKALANQFNIRNNQKHAIKFIENLENKVKTEGKQAYNQVLRGFGFVSTIQYMESSLKNIENDLSARNYSPITMKFLEKHGLSPEENIEQVVQKIDEIYEHLNEFSEYYNVEKNLLRIVDKEGNVISSPNPTDAIMNYYSKDIPTDKELNILRIRIAEMNKKSTQNEFRNQKEKQKSNKLTEQEAEILKKIDQNINKYSSSVRKQINFVQSYIKEPLENLHRFVGVQTGQYWTSREGRSGLNSSSQIRILEYATGRPHSENAVTKDAIQTIKTSPYSGISSSSVYHDRFGMHAQYIADIAPNETKTSEILYHDNTWGAKEKKNTWIDSSGLTRTDYEGNMGGELGYIVNDDYQNGNLVDRILDEMVIKIQPENINSKQYNRITNASRDSYVTPQYDGVIMDGRSIKSSYIAEHLYHTFIDNNDVILDRIYNFAQKHTTEELKSILQSLPKANSNWRYAYNELNNRIFDEFFKINTESDYNKLANDDYLKVVLEKIAFNENYSLPEMQEKISKIKDVESLNKLKKYQIKNALKEFEYGFNKNTQTLDYLKISILNSLITDVQQLLDADKKKITTAQKKQIRNIFDKYKANFDGSAKNLINNIMYGIDNVISSFSNDAKTHKDLSNKYKQTLEEALYFNQSDLSKTNIDKIINFIDKNFNPENDEEFIKIYRKIQDMTIEEFEKTIADKISLSDLKIKTMTGFEVLKRIQRQEEGFNNALINTVYSDSIAYDTTIEPSKPTKIYKKLYYEPGYKINKDFQSTYQDLKMDLSILSLPKLFNQNKAEGIHKYGMYPAYPKIEYIDKEKLSESVNSFVKLQFENIGMIRAAKNQLKYYNIERRLSNYESKLDANSIPTDYQYKNIRSILKEFIEIQHTDKGILTIMPQAIYLAKLPKGTPWKEYQKHLADITNYLKDLEYIASKEYLIDYVKEQVKTFKDNINQINAMYIQDKYQRHFTKDVNDLMQAYIKQKPQDEIDDLVQKLHVNIEKYNILHNPEELLEKFVLASAKDRVDDPLSQEYGDHLSELAEYSMLGNVEAELMDAVSEGVELGVRKSLEIFSREILAQNKKLSFNDFVYDMTNKFLVGKKYDTALMFVEKLGLTEEYMETAQKILNFDEFKSNVKKTSDFILSSDKFVNKLGSLLNSYEKLFNEKDCDYKNLISSLKSEIKKNGEKYSMPKPYMKQIFETLNSIEQSFDNNPEIAKSLTYKNFTQRILSNIDNNIAQEVEYVNGQFERINTILNFIQSMNIPVNSPARKIQAQMVKKFNQVIDYSEKLNNLQRAK